ncbi:Hpt domain-containing protein [Achromobacter pestifer]|uniref:HPt domain-containing protein n=1 Tax=Achromobacter pestifer TaxID=1353889 RepID=A0A6S6YXS3_9BURK|nr:Hpt domain-containing protein [Achromobacter pestifer]CAB3635451.1 hypothetical protein LMG3431_01511 [Achromobacter pestifer]
MLGNLTSADPARIRALVNAFIDANDQDLQQLRALYANRDRAALHLLAHRIKGAAQMTGDHQLSARCTELGRICDDPNEGEQALDACIQRIEMAINEFGESCLQISREVQLD